MEKNKKPISIDFDAIDSDLQEIQEEQKSAPSKMSEPIEKEKKPRLVKKKELSMNAVRERGNQEKESHVDQKGSDPMENHRQNEITKIQNDIGLNLDSIINDQDPNKDKTNKKQFKTKENRSSSEPQEYEIEFWKDQNASCYMTFKPGIERQIVKRVKNNNISYTIEYRLE